MLCVVCRYTARTDEFYAMFLGRFDDRIQPLQPVRPGIDRCART